MHDFSNYVVVITGGARGIGFTIATLFGAARAVVIVIDLNEDAVHQAVQSLKDQGSDAYGHVGNVTDSKGMEELFAAIAKEHGKIDALINNAGVTRDNLMLRMKEEEWQMVLDINLKGTFICTQKVFKHMMRARTGSIINIASQAAKSGFPHAQAYTSSKHGLVGLVRSAAIELGPHQITVNNVCPNHVTTGLGAWQNEYFSKVVGAASVEDYLKAMADRIPLKRPGKPEDTAKAVAFLCSDEAEYITAESMNVSGGEEPH